MVIKGVIEIKKESFKKGKRGKDIEIMERIEIWKKGLEYENGKGNGVGYYIQVNEGKKRIQRKGEKEIMKGMIM